MSTVIKLAGSLVAVIVCLGLLLTALPSKAEAHTFHHSVNAYPKTHKRHFGHSRSYHLRHIRWHRARHHRYLREKRAHRLRHSSYYRRLAVVHYAKRHVGAPYPWGATGPYVFDCSGLIYAAYRSVGRHIPRTTQSQLRGLYRPRGRRMGDLVFSSSPHVALYIGHGRVIEAPHTGARVRYSSSARFRYATRRVG